MPPITICEHDRFPDTSNIAIEHLGNSSLLRYEHATVDERKAGFYAYYRIGAEWLGNQPLVVTPKPAMQNIDFLKMLSTCFTDDIAPERLSGIYTIQPDSRAIETEIASSFLSPIILLHFLAILKRICTRGLKRNYILHEENISTTKGSIQIFHNHRQNVIPRRLDRFYCRYSEFSINCPENRMLKKALEHAERILHTSYRALHTNSIRQTLQELSNRFGDVNSDIDRFEIKSIKRHKLYPDYREALRLAELILQRQDTAPHRASSLIQAMPPFYIDMSLLYELYVYGILHKHFKPHVIYQFNAPSGIPDFLYIAPDRSPLILDAKYKPYFDKGKIPIDDLRQLSGYARDKRILKKLGANEDPIACVFIYPQEGITKDDPFSTSQDILSTPALEKYEDFLQMYKIAIPLPLLKQQ